ncbi:MAG: 50S ribosomal protein L3 [Candidatus Omnitrophica bacterium]|nr:50S ribosomal protein L3 [Candidatus Omnitrophota bacterium]
MIREIYGKKIGMTQVFDEVGNLLPTTLIEVEPVCVLEKVTYSNQTKAKIGCFKIKEKRIGKVKKPIKGYFDKMGVEPYKLIKEVDVEEGADFSFSAPSAKEQPQEEAKQPQEEVGKPQEEVQEENIEAKPSDSKETDKADKTNKEEPVAEPTDPRQIGLEIFEIGEKIDVRAKTKGKGFAGGMKRHGWSGQPSSHGHTMHRRLGSAGASAYPSKIIKGLGMPGHMGDCYRTTKNLKVLKIDKDKDLIFLQGNVPGSRGAIVSLKKIK